MTKDAEAGLKDSTYKKMYYFSIGKLTAIWNMSHYSTKAADAIEEIAKRKLKAPNATRWMSFYNSVALILELKPFLNDICERLEKPKSKQREIEFLEEYVKVTEPLARALIILEGENDCHLGYVLPMLRRLKLDVGKMNNLGDLKF